MLNLVIHSGRAQLHPVHDVVDGVDDQSHHSHPVVQFIKYGIAGGIATAVDIGLFYFLSLKVFPALEPDTAQGLKGTQWRQTMCIKAVQAVPAGGPEGVLKLIGCYSSG